jgi:hypothetical protein
MNAPPLSDSQINTLLDKKVNIVTYEDIHKYDSVDELLGCYKQCIILFCNKPNYGHWTTLFICPTDGKLNYFNSYGDLKSKYEGYPDAPLKLIDKKYRKESYQDYPYLTDLMIESDYDLEYNPYDFQKLANNIKTCGYWCVLRLFCKEMDDKKFYNFVMENCRSLNMEPDEFVVSVINSNCQY